MESTAGKANPDDKPRPTCQDCGQTFSVKKSLYRHQRGRCPTDREKSESHPKEQEERSPKAPRESVPTRPTTQPSCDQSLSVRKDQVMNELNNDFCTLRFHKQSLRGAVQDYVIDFKEDECDIETCLLVAMDLFIDLMKYFENDVIKARLIADVNYLRMTDDEAVNVNYHFASYSQEYVCDPQEFYERHMQKIISRMDTFHVNGSHLLMNKVNHIHIAISKLWSDSRMIPMMGTDSTDSTDSIGVTVPCE